MHVIKNIKEQNIQPGECSSYVLKFLVNLSLNVLTKEVLIKKSAISVLLDSVVYTYVTLYV